MTTISRTQGHYHAGARRRGDQSLWHDAGIALAIVLAVLVMAVAASRVTSGVQSHQEWPTATDQTQLHGWEGSAPAGLFPLSPVPYDEFSQ